MKTSRFTDSQIIAILKQAEAGSPVPELYREHGISNATFYDWLAHHLFETLDEIQEFATRWLWTYNHDRPNMALGGITPKQKLALAA